MPKNPIFQQMQGSQKGPMGMMDAFPKFMNQFQGKNPSEMIRQLVSSGKISQGQLDQAQKMAQQMQGQLDQFKGMFGFK